MKDTRISLTLSQMQHLSSLDTKLRQVVEDLMDVWPAKNMVITSIYRTPEEDAALGASGIHSCDPHRAIDIRITNLSGGQEKADEVAGVINSIWQYDPNRTNLKVAVSKLHGSGPHLHVQVHPNTIRKLLN